MNVHVLKLSEQVIMVVIISNVIISALARKKNWLKRYLIDNKTEKSNSKASLRTGFFLSKIPGNKTEAKFMPEENI